MSQILVPNSTISAGDWTFVPASAGSLQGALALNGTAPIIYDPFFIFPGDIRTTIAATCRLGITAPTVDPSAGIILRGAASNLGTGPGYIITIEILNAATNVIATLILPASAFTLNPFDGDSDHTGVIFATLFTINTFTGFPFTSTDLTGASIRITQATGATTQVFQVVIEVFEPGGCTGQADQDIDGTRQAVLFTEHGQLMVFTDEAAFDGVQQLGTNFVRFLPVPVEIETGDLVLGGDHTVKGRDVRLWLGMQGTDDEPTPGFTLALRQRGDKVSNTVTQSHTVTGEAAIPTEHIIPTPPLQAFHRRLRMQVPDPATIPSGTSQLSVMNLFDIAIDTDKGGMT